MMCDSVRSRRFILILFLLIPTTLPAATARILSKALCATFPTYIPTANASRRIPAKPTPLVLATPMRWYSTKRNSSCHKTINLSSAQICSAIPDPHFLEISPLIQMLTEKDLNIPTIIHAVHRATYDYIIHLQTIRWQDPSINQYIPFEIPKKFQTPGKRAMILALIPRDRHEEANAEMDAYFKRIRQL